MEKTSQWKNQVFFVIQYSTRSGLCQWARVSERVREKLLFFDKMNTL